MPYPAQDVSSGSIAHRANIAARIQELRGKMGAFGSKVVKTKIGIFTKEDARTTDNIRQRLQKLP